MEKNKMWLRLARLYIIAAAIGPCPWAGAQSTAPIAVVGVQTGIDTNTGQRPARQNINDLYARGGPQWDLYVLALSSLQTTNETDELSYFQISGIHGLPFTSWNGVGQVAGGSMSGYCPHNELIFATWHRPYVALFEQILVSHAVSWANQYPDSSAPAYQAAAQLLRQPYWDWAADGRLPIAATSPNVTVNGPKGAMSLRNPLYNYQFQQPAVEASMGGPLAAYAETIRCPLPGDPSTNNATASDVHMAVIQQQLRDYAYDAFTRTNTFDIMAYDASGGASFENPHNLVHNSAGCGGTLGDINWSAFDPLFMLHHCNTDRLIAMWQAIHYDNFMFTTSGVSNGQWGTAAKTVTTADSPLKPFFQADLATLHTSNSVAAIKTFGYTYPEINDWSTTPEELATYVRAQVNTLYGPDDLNGGANSGSKSRIRGARYDKPPSQQQFSKYYTAEVSVNRSELPLPVTVNLVVSGDEGGVVLGRMAILGMPSTGMTYASIPIQRAMLRMTGNLSSVVKNLVPDKVIPFLQQSLVLEIRKNDGTTVPLDTVPSLQLEVQDLDYVPPANNNSSAFPGFGKATTWPVKGGGRC